MPENTAIELVAMYHTRGARFFADLGVADDLTGEERAERVALHEAIRRRYKVIVDLPAILLAELK